MCDMHREAIVPGKGVGRDQKKGQGINKAEQGAEGGGGGKKLHREVKREDVPTLKQ